MAEKHDLLVSKFRGYLSNQGCKIIKKGPFVDYRPDIFAMKGDNKIFVEAELNQTLYSDHTLDQLTKMYEYLRKSKKYHGILVIPKKYVSEAILLIESVFGDNKIRVKGN